MNADPIRGVTAHGGQSRVAEFARERLARARGSALSERLVRMGVLSPRDARRISEAQGHNGDFVETAVKLNLVSREALQTAAGVRAGLLREDATPGLVPDRLVVAKQPTAPQAEQFRSIRTRLITTVGDEELTLFSVASIEATREADFIAANLAASFAAMGKNTLLFDADLRGDRMARFLAIKTGRSLVDVLRGRASLAEAISQTAVANLSLASAGGPSHDAQELLAGARFAQTLEAAQAAFDLVIATSTPFGAVSDAQFVWSRTKNVYVAIRKDRDRFNKLKQMQAVMRQIGAAAVGVALTR